MKNHDFDLVAAGTIAGVLRAFGEAARRYAEINSDPHGERIRRLNAAHHKAEAAAKRKRRAAKRRPRP